MELNKLDNDHVEVIEQRTRRVSRSEVEKHIKYLKQQLKHFQAMEDKLDEQEEQAIQELPNPNAKE